MKNKAFSGSLILNRLGRAADSISRGFSRSFLGMALLAYDAERKDADRSRIVSFFSALAGKIRLKSAQQRIMKGFDASPVLRFVKNLYARLLTLRMRQYGVFTFTFGLYTVLMYALGRYAFPDAYAGSFISLFIGALALVMAMPIILSRKTLQECLSTGHIARLLFSGIFGLLCDNDYGHVPHRGRSEIAFAAGMVLGVSTFAIDCGRLLLTLLIMLVLCLVLCSPEGGVMLMIIGAPFADVRYLGFFAAFVLFSYLLKVLRGKRSLKLEFCDAAVLLYAVVVLFGGIFSVRPGVSFTYAVKITLFILLYIVCVNVIISEKWILRFRNAFVFSCVSCVVTALAGGLLMNSSHFLFETPAREARFYGLSGSAEELAQMIVLCGFFVFSAFLKTDKRIRKVFIFMLICAELYCLYYSLSAWAMLAFFIAFAVFLLLYSNRNIFVVLLFAGVSLVVDYILPASGQEALNRIKEAGSAVISARLPVWRASLRMAGDHLLGGIGKGVFSVMYPGYVSETSAGARSAENIYIQELTETGVFGLLIFLICAVLFIQSCLKLNSLSDRRSMTDPNSGLCGIIGILLLGFVSNVWQNEKILLLFWIAAGYTAACRRSGMLHLRKHIGFEKGGFSCDV